MHRAGRQVANSPFAGNDAAHGESTSASPAHVVALLAPCFHLCARWIARLLALPADQSRFRRRLTPSPAPPHRRPDTLRRFRRAAAPAPTFDTPVCAPLAIRAAPSVFYPETAKDTALCRGRPRR